MAERAGRCRCGACSADELDRARAAAASHQGVVADVEERRALRASRIWCSGATGAPLIVVLDSIEDPHNVGAILRTVDAAGADGVVRQSRHAARARRGGGQGVGRRGRAREDRRGREHRAGARGAEGSRGLDGRAGRATPRSATTRSISRCRRRSWSGPRGAGLRRLVRERCDWLASIPMAGHVQSLNVSVAAGIALFEAVRQRARRSEYNGGLSARPAGRRPRSISPAVDSRTLQRGTGRAKVPPFVLAGVAQSGRAADL